MGRNCRQRSRADASGMGSKTFCAWLVPPSRRRAHWPAWFACCEFWLRCGKKTGCKKHARAGKTSRDCRVRIKEAREKGKLHGLLLPS